MIEVDVDGKYKSGTLSKCTRSKSCCCECGPVQVNESATVCLLGTEGAECIGASLQQGRRSISLQHHKNHRLPNHSSSGLEN